VTPAAPKFRRPLLKWWRQSARAFPWRETRDPYHVLVAECLLQKTASYKVIGTYPQFVDTYPTVEALASAAPAEVEKLIAPLGLPRRAQNLVFAARILRDQNGARVPRNADSLMRLPGVGRYTAHAVLCFAFGSPRPLVDEVVARVYRRFFGMTANGPAYADLELWDFVSSVVPNRGSREFAYAVLDLAAAICTVRNPKCFECPLTSQCAWALRGEGERAAYYRVEVAR
jgi:A/G-specific adenine glycosylase